MPSEKEIEELIEDLLDGDHVWEKIEALAEIGEAVIEPIMKALEKESKGRYQLCFEVLYALVAPESSSIEKIGEPADEALFEAFQKYNWHGDLCENYEIMNELMEYMAETGHPHALKAIQSVESSKDWIYHKEPQCVAMWCASADENTPQYEQMLEYLIDNILRSGEGGRSSWYEWKFPSGDKATEVLIQAMKEQFDDGGQSWEHGDDFEWVIAELLEERDWKPKTDEERVDYFLAKTKKKYQNEDVYDIGYDELVRTAYKIFKTDDKEKILKFLESDDPAMIQMGVSLLKATVKK